MANYNCTDSANSTYGAGAFGTCANAAPNPSASPSVGVPNTGVFQQVISSGGFTIVAPLVVAIVIVVIATVTMNLRKKTS